MSTPLNQDEIDSALQELQGWAFRDDKLTRDFSLGDFRSAMAFLVRVAFEAEQRDHHPEIVNLYKNVTISLCTHDAGGKVTQKDVELARAIGKIPT